MMVGRIYKVVGRWIMLTENIHRYYLLEGRLNTPISFNFRHSVLTCEYVVNEVYNTVLLLLL